MTTHMHREISALKDRLLELSAEVEKSINCAGRALETFDENLACQIITNDNRINDLEVNIEEDCLKILALYQPVAHDLRTVIAILKVNNDLERMADLAVNICKYVMKIKGYGIVPVSPSFEPMFETCLTMVRMCLDAFMKEDIGMASKVCEMDNEVDMLNIKIISEIQEELKREEPQGPIDSTLFMLSVCRTVERIADYATNIAEDVYYMVSGKIIRHHADMLVK
ncbi:MAG: phosphate signaling complex protein PhoU [Lentisphaeraceae bacterium]|nr:phosphate signaling complex protein PhoU [Lentisphaeraceae bacterium]